MHAQRADGVEDREHHHADICKDSRPHVGRAKGKDKAEVAAKQAMKAVRAAKLAKQICLTTPYNVKR